MSALQTNLNELSKDPATQLAQLNYMGNDIINWSQNLQAQLLVDYTEPTDKVNETLKSTDFAPLKNFTFNFVPNNPLCTVTFSLLLQGEGFIGIFLNGVLIQKVYFLNASAQQLTFTKKFNFSKASQKISLQWKSNSGATTITKINSDSQPGTNLMQVSSENS